MIKLAVFDLDGTLCDYGKAVLPEDVRLLKEIASSGVKIAVCSGKPVFYLCGFCRQLGIEDAILIGENGGSMQMGIALPPPVFYTLKIDKATCENIAFFRRKILHALPHIWCQPNELEFTPFPQKQEEFDIIESIIAQNADKLGGIEIIRHPDCIDFLPAGINKGEALRQLAQTLRLTPDEIVSVGNAHNDYAMFAFTGISLGVQVPDSTRVTKNFENLTLALTYLKQLL